MIRAAVIIVLVALVVLGSRLVDKRSPDTSVTTAELNTPNDSDYYLLGAQVRQMDAQGKPEYVMDVAETLHFPDKSARLTDIHVDYFGQPDYDWDLDAGRGRIPPGEKEILLHDGVEMLRNDGQEQTLRVETERAWIRPDKDQVDTDVDVRASAPGQTATATGMTIYLKQNRIKLNKNVQVTYEP